MTNAILDYGPPPLTEEAADTALDLINFIAAQVRGTALIDFAPTVRPLWRQHLANSFQQLPPWTRNWYATAPQLMATIRAQWPLLDPMQRNAVLQQWAGELPAMLGMLQPVLGMLELQKYVQAQDELSRTLTRIADMRHEMMKSVAERLRREEAVSRSDAPAPAQTPQASNESAAIAELERMRAASQSLGAGMIRSTNATIDLMNAMSGRVRTR
jgi:hypothetical protein